MAYYNPITTVASVGTQTLPVPVTIASATEPTTRENGGTLRQGDNWYNTDTSSDYIWIVNSTTQEGSWKIIGSGASGGSSGGGGGDFEGGFVQNTIFVGGSSGSPNLSLQSDGGILAKSDIIVYSDSANIGLTITDATGTTAARIRGDGTISTGNFALTAGESVSLTNFGVQLNPDGSINLGGNTLKTTGNKLFINDIEVIEADTNTTANTLLTNPTTVVNNTSTLGNTTYSIAGLTALPDLGTLNTQEGYNNWLYASLEYLDTKKLSDAPSDGLTYGRNNGAWTQVHGITIKGTVDTINDLNNISNPQDGDLYVVASNGHGYVYESGSWVDIGDITGPAGPQGPAGDAATITVGSTTTGNAGTNASVVNTGSTSAAVFDFTIPQGTKGDTGSQGEPGSDGAAGDTGPAGTAATVAVGTTTTGTAGTDASVTNTGTTSEAVFNFTIPQGVQGETGSQGNPGVDGNDGSAATIQAGTTTTLTPGTGATVANIGTTAAAIFDFGIPQGTAGVKGDPGTDGTPGVAATATVGTTSTLAPGADATVSNVGTTAAAIFDFGIPSGATGSQGNAGSDGVAATIAAGTTSTGAAGSNAAVTNSGSSAAAVFDFTIPQGDQGIQGPEGPAGTSIALAGTVATVDELPDYAPAGTMYIVELDGDGYVSDGASPTSSWTDVGKIQGPTGPQGPAGPVAGVNTQIVFNDNGSAAGASNLTFSNNTIGTTNVTATGTITANAFVGDGSGITGLNIPNSFEFKGDTNITGNAPAGLGSAQNGFFYLNTTTGVASASNGWLGLDGNTIQQDQTVFWDGTRWFAGGLQSNITTLPLSGGTMSGDITFAGTQTFPVAGITNASLSAVGVTQLSSSLVSASEALAATPKAIKTVNDTVTTLTSTVGTNTADIVTNTASALQNTNNISTLTSDLATTDGNVATNTANIATNTTGIANVKTTADAALSKTGGTMAGNIVMGGTSVINFSGSQTFPSDIVDFPDATISTAGIVQLTNDKTSTSETLAPTADSLSAVYTIATNSLNTANAALPKSGGTMTGDIAFNDTQTFPGTTPPDASTTVKGIVQLNSTTSSNSETLAATAGAVKDAFDRGTLGVTNAATAQDTAEDANTLAAAALPKTGGTMTGQITFASNQLFPSSITDNFLPLTGGTLSGQLNVGSKFTVSTGGSITGASAVLSSAILIDTGSNESSIFPLFRGRSANKSRFIVEANGTIRVGDDLDMNTDSGGDTITMTTAGNITLVGKATSAATDDADGGTTLTTKDYVLGKIGSAGGGSVTSVGSGNGLTGGPITDAGTLSVKPADSIITVSASGVGVDTDNIPYPVTAVNNKIGIVVLNASDVDAVDISGDNMTGDLTLATDKVTLSASDGAATFAGSITGDTSLTLKSSANAQGIFVGQDGSDWKTRIYGDGVADFSGAVTALSFQADQTDASNNVFSGRNGSTTTSTIKADGSANFSGTVTADKFSGVVQVSESAPAGTATPGDLWYDSTDGVLYVYYTDLDSSQWVDVRPAAGKIATVDSIQGKTGNVVLTASDVDALPIGGGTVLGSVTVTGNVVSTNINTFKTNLTNAVTASTDLATLKTAIINALTAL